jgi:putative FmdB family regulatory protein
MPIYQYYCEKCAKEFDKKRLMADIDKPALCPTCGKKGSKMVTAFASAVGIRMKSASSKIFREQPNTKAKSQSAKSKKASKAKKSK